MRVIVPMIVERLDRTMLISVSVLPAVLSVVVVRVVLTAIRLYVTVRIEALVIAMQISMESIIERAVVVNDIAVLVNA